MLLGVALVVSMLAITGIAAAMGGGGGGMTDTTPPTISNIQPTGTISTSSTTVSASYSDSGMMASGINAASATLTVSGAAVSGCTATTSSIICTASGMADGTHTINISVADNKGNTKTATGTFTVSGSGGSGGTAPTISNIQPTGTITTGSSAVSAYYSDTDGIDTASATLTVSGATVSGCSADSEHIVCTASGMADGAHTISVSVADSAGTTGYGSGTFTVNASGLDLETPVITNIQPTGTIYTTSTTISADYSDPAPSSGIKASSAMIHVDGGMLFSCTATTTHVSCTKSGLSVGTHTVQIYIGDNAGHTGTATSTFTVSNGSPTSPVITNIQPTGTITTGSTTVSADYSDPDGINAASAALTVSGATVSGCSASTSHISCTASGMTDGSHTVNVSVTDNAGTTGIGSGTFTVSTNGPDLVAPVISNIQPTGTVSPGTITISADYNDAAPSSGIAPESAMIHVDGDMLFDGCTASTTHASCPASGLSAGTHEIEIFIEDNAGNLGYKTGSFTIAAAIPAKPVLNLSAGSAFWGSYADYVAHQLSLTLTVTNAGPGAAYAVAITGSTPNNGVTLITAMPVSLGDIAAGSSQAATVQYQVPAGVGSFRISNTGSASDATGTGYTYP